MGKLGKHDHKMTDKLKGLIFALVMLAPFIAILIECLYVIYNQNSLTSYTGTPQDLFYNAVNNVATQPLFNWTEDTAIYSAVEGMTTGLEFGTSGNTLAILLTYWALNTAIYIVFDIIIFCFVKITHLLND